MATKYQKFFDDNQFREQLTGDILNDSIRKKIEEYQLNIQKNITGEENYQNDDLQIKIVPFGKYRIKVRLSDTNEFIGIEEIEINKDFLSQKQKIGKRRFHDIEKFYSEE